MRPLQTMTLTPTTKKFLVEVNYWIDIKVNKCSSSKEIKVRKQRSFTEIAQAVDFGLKTSCHFRCISLMQLK